MLDWPADGKLKIENMDSRVNQVDFSSGEQLSFRQQDRSLEIDIPSKSPNSFKSIIVTHRDKIAEKHSDSRLPKIEASKKYIWDQFFANMVINIIINGLIAFFTFRLRDPLPSDEMAVDALITVAIISFLVSWIGIPSARAEVSKGKIFPWPSGFQTFYSFKLSSRPVLGALIIMLLFIVVFGGLLTIGFILITSPGGSPTWAYILVKTLYAGFSAGLTSAFTINGVLKTNHPTRI
jgi:hypothetical protein